VDAGLRQLAAEGFMHNRARMSAAGGPAASGRQWTYGITHQEKSGQDCNAAAPAGTEVRHIPELQREEHA
jgi:hypothetical protein